MINERQKPYQTTIEEQALRWAYAEGTITIEEFNQRYAKLEKAGLIRRSGRVVT